MGAYGRDRRVDGTPVAGPIVPSSTDNRLAHISVCVAELLAELRPDIPEPIRESFAYEAVTTPDLPSVAELHPDARWCEAREAAYPECETTARRATAWHQRTGGPDGR